MYKSFNTVVCKFSRKYPITQRPSNCLTLWNARTHKTHLIIFQSLIYHYYRRNIASVLYSLNNIDEMGISSTITTTPFSYYTTGSKLFLVLVWQAENCIIKHIVFNYFWLISTIYDVRFKIGKTEWNLNKFRNASIYHLEKLSVVNWWHIGKCINVHWMCIDNRRWD